MAASLRVREEGRVVDVQHTRPFDIDVHHRAIVVELDGPAPGITRLVGRVGAGMTERVIGHGERGQGCREVTDLDVGGRDVVNVAVGDGVAAALKLHQEHTAVIGAGAGGGLGADVLDLTVVQREAIDAVGDDARLRRAVHLQVVQRHRRIVHQVECSVAILVGR